MEKVNDSFVFRWDKSCILFSSQHFEHLYNLSVALGNGEGKEVNIFWEINLARTIWLLCPSCIVSLASSLLRISLSVSLVRPTAFL